MPLNERDWKVLQNLKRPLLERFCQVALFSAEQIIQDKTKTYHERYGALYEFVQQRDKALALAFDGLRRSNALMRLVFMRQAELFTEEEFGQFSEDTRRRVEKMLEGHE
ncbi:peptide ABC transporter substrate-binding protein [Solimonas marina]|uniref:Peptide ABC transporter substrate-binding protein n=1 Tax=Solimonas marina TaxID=2714601 RepID=A0A969WBA1_9GAMM|nr:peptide ABC transporter substrate-binding protein [Solimonas marina]NKF23354.1 peptide ABC transporter substrate-binding protein [Solimonas marina]